MNLWRRFQQLASPPSLVTVGTVVDTDFGACTVEFPGGSRLRVQGAGTVGQSYFIREGRLEGAAPALTALDIEV
jgi:hypothetical protein